MANKNLIIALSFAAVFGAALLWLVLYYIHSYLHRKWVELEHWFHVITPPKWRSPCRQCEGTGRAVFGEKEKSRSRSRRRREGSRERSRPMHGRGQRTIEDTEWNGHGRMQQPRAALSASSPAQRQGIEEQYNPWAAWQSQAPGGQQMGMSYPQPAIYPHMYPQANPQMSLFMMPQQQAPQMAMPVPESMMSSKSTHHKRERKEYTERPEERQPKAAQTKPKSSTRGAPKVRQTDYVHIVDEYPPIVQERIKKNAPPSSSSSSSSSSSTSTEPPEEVYRTSIPQAAPRFVNPTRFQFPSYPYQATRTWEAPISYPRQWTGGQGTGGGEGRGPTKQARYAPSYMKARVWRSKDVNADWRHRAPNFEHLRWPAGQRREYTTRTPRRQRSMVRSDVIRKQKEHENTPPKQRATASPQQEASSPAHQPAPPLHHPPASEDIPNMSPMPQPVIEEPPSEAGSPKAKTPTVAANASKPRAPSAPMSPLLGARPLSRGSSSGFSSLHE